eukprot:TRINITY_DN8859_c0_g1_i1.p1 TRINITY_DN8859_c0_g1~~TRINITY_DN8859_c0_g1_i1.p1  ORF type:complete len:499 (+),score=103.34 TRINITY_DN8859_c0_g1_i1:34-1497(+)
MADKNLPDTPVIDRNAAAFDKRLKDIVDSQPDAERRKQLQAETEGFHALFQHFVKSRNKVIDWSKIRPPAAHTVLPHADLGSVAEEQRKALLKRLCVVKLNGGLATTMGCVGPKSTIEVQGDNTFLDLTVQQIVYLNNTYDSDVPLILMNSFNTHADTEKIVQKYNDQVTILNFNQSRYPRIYKDSLLPLPKDFKGDKEDWYPPGHGDLYEAFKNSGLLEKMLQQGRDILFMANVDNLGAIVDFSILNHMASTKCEFIMELTDKTRADIKGGTLIEYEGVPKLLEIAQVPPNKVEEFKSIKKFKIFNTNNLWINLNAMKRILGKGAFNSMDVISNPKSVGGKAVIQLERAAGAGMEYFDGAIGVNVSRRRFLPVKTTSDLFLMQSNLYSQENGTLVPNPKRPIPSVPLVKLGNEFSKVPDFMRRIASIPDILELDHLTVSGDVTFGANIVLKGTVIIVANQGSRIDIPSGSEFENKVVSGNLRILDH